MCEPRLFRLIGLGLIGLGLIGLGLICLGLIGVLRPRRFLGARGHPGIVLGRAAPRRYTGRLAAHPVRQVRQMLARGLPGARRQRNAGKAEQCPFECREGMIHLGKNCTGMWRSRRIIMAALHLRSRLLHNSGHGPLASSSMPRRSPKIPCRSATRTSSMSEVTPSLALMR